MQPSTPLESPLIVSAEQTHEERLAAAEAADRHLWETFVKKDWYPSYHIAPRAGWMNDPNGLCYFDGLYHVFYQHHPFDANWGPMHWGHATSEDLVQWKHQPVALAPGDACDRDGCFSGSAVVHDQKLYLFYTGHIVLEESQVPQGRDPLFQQQCLAVSSDGLRFEKKGAVVRPPRGYTHFRDPKVWQQDGRWWMVCGARDNAKDLGQLLLFSTEDLEHWDEHEYSVLGITDDKNVFMWECPDMFRLSAAADSFYLLFSPQGKRAQGYDYRNRFQSGYQCGRWDPGRDKEWIPTSDFRELDHGHDFYAPQTFLAADGRRRLCFGWFDMWESPMPSKQHGWSGCLTLPREVVLDPASVRLRMRPAAEVEGLRVASSHTVLEPLVVSENGNICVVEDAACHELCVVLNVETSTAEKYGVWLGDGAEVYVDAQSRRVVVNRHYPAYMLSGYRSCELPEGMLLHLRVFIDRSSVEVFVNDGEETFSTRVFPEPGARTLRLFATNGTAEVVQGDLWKLREDAVTH